MKDAVNHPVLERLDAALHDRVPSEPVALSGEWSSRSRRRYAAERQLGTGCGPFVDVMDRRWQGALSCPGSTAVMAFLLTADTLYYVKAPEMSLALPVDLSLHAYADDMPDRATFTARLAGAFLPGVPVSIRSDVPEPCTVPVEVVRTGRVSCVARAGSASVFVLLLPRIAVEVGRKRLWRLRQEVASSLPSEICELLTRRRAGSLRSAPG